jgi:hypothetical protein
MEGLLGHLEHLKTTAPTPNKRLREAVMNSWAKLQEYYQLTDGSYSIYAAATLFHPPPPRMKHFTYAWTGETAHWIPRMRAAVFKTWNDEYLLPAKAKEAVATTRSRTAKEEAIHLSILAANTRPYEDRVR